MENKFKLIVEKLIFEDVGDFNLYNFSISKFYNLVFLIGGNNHERDCSNYIYEINLITKKIKYYKISDLNDSSKSWILYNLKSENFYIINFGGFINELKRYNKEIIIHSIFSKGKINKNILYSSYKFSDNIFSNMQKICKPYLKKDFFTTYIKAIKKIIFIGGWDPFEENNDTCFKKLEIWLLDQNWIWEKIKLSKEISNRRCVAGILLNNYLYLFGGALNEGYYQNDFFRLNILDFSIEDLNINNTDYLPEPRIGHTINFDTNNRIWLYGGINEEGYILDNLNYYDLNLKKWFYIKDLELKGRIGSKMIIEDNNIFIIGGLITEELYTKSLKNKINEITKIKWDQIKNNNNNSIYKNNLNCIINDTTKFNLTNIPKIQKCNCIVDCSDNYRQNRIQSEYFYDL